MMRYLGIISVFLPGLNVLPGLGLIRTNPVTSLLLRLPSSGVKKRWR
jgi:hypothetical protein